MLPEPTSATCSTANQVTSGTECLPYRVTLGDFISFYTRTIRRHRHGNVEGFMTGSYGPCRLGKYAIEQMQHP